MSDQLQLQPTQPMSTNTKRGIEPRPHESGPTSDHLMAQLTTWPKRFREKFTITEGCWVWTAEPARKGQPYGVRRCRSCRDERGRRRLRSRGPQGGRGSDDA